MYLAIYSVIQYPRDISQYLPYLQCGRLYDASSIIQNTQHV